MSLVGNAGATLIGRDREVSALRQHVADARDGRGVLLLLSGEAGIGKTSLLGAAARIARQYEASFGIGRCDESTGAPELAPWKELLGDLASHPSFDLAVLPPPFGNAIRAQTAYELMRAVSVHLIAAARSRPIVLALDDLHWADADTIELLWYVTRDLASVPLLVIATYRPDEVARGHVLYGALPRLHRDRPVATLRLGSLNLEDTTRLVESRYGPCSADLAAQLHQRSEGNPFYAVELLRHFADQKLLVPDASGRLSPTSQLAGVPAILEQVIVQRVARLGPDPEEFLIVAAVVGLDWDLTVVESVLGWPEEKVLAALESALGAQVVHAVGEPAERYRFVHALIRDVLYNQPVARRRRHLHLRIAAALERLAENGQAALAPPATLAHHYGAAEQWDQVAKYAMGAGDESRDRHAIHSSLRFYQQAVAALRGGNETWAMAPALYERLGRAFQVLNQQADAEQAFVEMLEAARGGSDRRSEARALARLGLMRSRRGRHEESVETCQLALQLADDLGDDALRALAHTTLAHTYEVVGELSAAAPHFFIAEKLARAGGYRDVLLLGVLDQAAMNVFWGRYPDAIRLAEEALALATSLREAESIPSAYWRLALALGSAGHYSRAMQAVQAGLDSANQSGERRNLARLLNTMGWLHFEVGDVDTARHYDREALDASHHRSSVGGVEAEFYSLLNLASDALAVDQIDEAETYLTDVKPMLDRWLYGRFRYLNRYQLTRAEILLRRHEWSESRYWIREARALATAKDAKKNLARCCFLEARALHGEGSVAEVLGRLREGIAIADEIGNPMLRWQGRLWLGEALLTHQPVAATALLRQAEEMVQAISREIGDERLRNCFVASPLVRQLHDAEARTGRTAEKPALPAGLSTREVEVLRLVAQGATNQEIAVALTISVKTVNTHLSSILGKIGVANRTGAAAFATRHGIGDGEQPGPVAPLNR